MSNSAGTLPVSTRVSGLGAKLSGADSDVSLALVDCDELNSACEVLAYTKTKSDAAKAARTQRIQPETRNDNAGAMKGDIELHSIIIKERSWRIWFRATSSGTGIDSSVVCGLEKICYLNVPSQAGRGNLKFKFTGLAGNQT